MVPFAPADPNLEFRVEYYKINDANNALTCTTRNLSRPIGRGPSPAGPPSKKNKTPGSTQNIKPITRGRKPESADDFDDDDDDEDTRYQTPSKKPKTADNYRDRDMQNILPITRAATASRRWPMSSSPSLVVRSVAAR
ncbi:hypothetical protein LTR65_009009 [Meristemomyces frigidus]